MFVMGDVRLQHPGARGVVLSLLLTTLSGCVTVYQPMGSLQRPFVVDPRLPNFMALRIFVRCVPEEKPKGFFSINLFPTNDADKLCQRVRTLFVNQGAEVEVSIPQDADAQVVPSESGKPDLIIDLRSRVLFDEDSTVLGVLSCLTCTLIPTMSEQSYAQEIIVRDGDGTLLASDTLKSRFVNYTGVGVWGVNWLLDVFVRPDNQELTGEGPQRDYSHDFYGQLSQLAYNARVRSKLLNNFNPAPASGAK